MTSVRLITEVSCATPLCGHRETVRTDEPAAALRALHDAYGWEVVGNYRTATRAHCPIHAAARRAEARDELRRVGVS